MILAALLPLVAMVAGKAIDTSPVTQGQSVLVTPDIIASAVLPYAACLCGARGLPLLFGSDGKQISYDKSDKDCSAARQRATAEALKLLENKPVPGNRAAAEYVDNALSDIDRFVDVESARRNADASRKNAGFGIPIIIEDVVQPAYQQYEDCLKTQVSYSEVSIDTILETFKRAMTNCRSVRDYAVSEAQAALERSGWEPARSATVVAATFTTADESWLMTGQRFRDSLIHQEPQQAPRPRRR